MEPTITKMNGEMKRMKVLMSIMWTNPKEPERNKERYEFGEEYMRPYYAKKMKEGVKWTYQGWSNGSRAHKIKNFFNCVFHIIFSCISPLFMRARDKIMLFSIDQLRQSNEY